MIISAEVIKMSVTITHYNTTIFKSPLMWKTKLRGPMVLLSGNYSLFNIYRKTVHVMYMCVPINGFVNPFTVQNDLLITFSLCHSSAKNI